VFSGFCVDRRRIFARFADFALIVARESMKTGRGAGLQACDVTTINAEPAKPAEPDGTTKTRRHEPWRRRQRRAV
jgi:hypothetical protein